MSWTAGIVESPTEQRNPTTSDIDILPTRQILAMINQEDARVASAVQAVLADLAIAVDTAIDCITAGGQVHYFGAGTSARIAALDAAELPPTFNSAPELFTAHIAGGPEALTRAIENAEDDWDQGEAHATAVGKRDLAIGLTASGRTPYVGGALRRAQATGAHTVLVTSNTDAPLAGYADLVISVDTGPEVIAGSTRMKAATAQKLILNAFSTAVMIRLGHTWSNLMISVQATNEKLRGRAVRILREATGTSEAACRKALNASNGDLRVALVALLGDMPAHTARHRLAAAGGLVREALQRP